MHRHAHRLDGLEQRRAELARAARGDRGPGRTDDRLAAGPGGVEAWNALRGLDYLPADANLVLGRLAFGPGPVDELARLRESGLRPWLAEQLRPPAGDDGECLTRIRQARVRIRYDEGKAPGPEYPAVDEERPLDTLSAPIEALWPRTDYKRPMAGPERFRPRTEVASACLIRAVYSRWQLREVLCDFWHNHFNVDASQQVQVNVALPAYDRDVIRKHALGRFASDVAAHGVAKMVDLLAVNALDLGQSGWCIAVAGGGNEGGQDGHA